MVQFGAFVVGEEDIGAIGSADVAAVGGIFEVVVGVRGEADEDWEVAQLAGAADLGALDDEAFAVGPVDIEPARGGHIDEVVDAIEGLAVADLAGALGGDVGRVALAPGAVVGVGGGVGELIQGACPAFVEVPDTFVARVPHPGRVPLIGDRAVAVVEVDVGVGGAGEVGDLDPGDQLAGGGGVLFDLVVQLGSVGVREEEVAAVGLGVGGEVGVGGFRDEDGEGGEVGGDLGGLDGDLLAVGPVRVVPGGGEGGEVHIEGVVAGGDGGVV